MSELRRKSVVSVAPTSLLRVAAALLILSILAACGTTAQPEAQESEAVATATSPAETAASTPETEPEEEPSTAPEGEPIRVGVTFGLTGPGSFVATAGRDGAVLAVEEINAAGGVLGRPIELSIQDSKGQPTEAINILQRFASQGIRLVVGPQTSTEVLAALPVMQELESVGITPMSTNPTITEQQGVGGNPWMFRVNPPDDSMARTVMNIAVDQLGDQRIATVARNDDLGRGATEAFTAGAEASGGEIISSDFFQSGGSYDFSSTLTRLRSLEPDAVVFVGTIEEGIPFIRQFHEQGLDARIYTRGVSITDALYDELGTDLVNGLHAVEPYYAVIDTPTNQAFVERWRERYGQDPINQGYFSYAAMHMLARAIEQAGTDDPAAVRDALGSVSYEGATGILEFDDHNQAHPDIYVGRVDCDATCGVVVVASAPSN